MTELISIQVNHVTKHFGQTIALQDISLFFEKGTMHGIIGPEGAGKTTLIRILLGLLKPNQGSIQFLQGNTILSQAVIRSKVAYMPQQQSLYPDLTIDEHLEFFRKLYQIEIAEYKKRRQDLLEITRLKPFVDRAAGKLSGGMYKKLGLMCALLRSPEIILLDEPTNGVDPISRREFWDLLYRLLDKKILILVTTAYMDEAERCLMVHLLDSGKVIVEGEPREILNKEQMQSFDELFLKLSREAV